jgi:hypothetical protein
VELARAVVARIDADPDQSGLARARHICTPWLRSSPSPTLDVEPSRRALDLRHPQLETAALRAAGGDDGAVGATAGAHVTEPTLLGGPLDPLQRVGLQLALAVEEEPLFRRAAADGAGALRRRSHRQARRRRNSICALTLRSSSSAQRCERFVQLRVEAEQKCLALGHRLSVERARVDDGLGVPVAAEHDQEVADHRCAALVVELDNVFLAASISSAISTMPTAPSTIFCRAAMTAPACWRCSIAAAISGA